VSQNPGPPHVERGQKISTNQGEFDPPLLFVDYRIFRYRFFLFFGKKIVLIPGKILLIICAGHYSLNNALSWRETPLLADFLHPLRTEKQPHMNEGYVTPWSTTVPAQIRVPPAL
jgi:hypothetical protein